VLQKFFKYLIIASKVGRLVDLTRTALKNGKCVVIGLQSTGESATKSEMNEMRMEEDLNFVSPAK